MLSRYFQTNNFKIQNKVLVYLIVFFILLPISNIYDLSEQDLKLFSYNISKLVLLLILVLCSITENIQISLSLGIFYIYISIFNKHHQENLEMKKKK